MGLFGLFGKKKELPPEEEKAAEEKPQAISAAEIQEWLDKTFSEKIKKVETDAREIYNEITSQLSVMESSLNTLGNAGFEIDDKTYTAANMVKDSFVKKAYSLMSNIQKIAKDLNYSLLKDFQKSTLDVMKELKNITPKQGILLSKYFGNESRSVAKNIDTIEKKLKSLRQFLDSDGKIMWLVEETKNNANRQTELLEQLKFLEKKEKELQKNIKELEKEKEKDDQTLKNNLKSKEWKFIEDADKEIENINKKTLEIENDINLKFSSMKRPFKKLRHSVDKKQVFPENPFRDIVLPDNENQWKTILLEIKKLSDEKKINLKESESKKVNNLINFMDTELPELKKIYNDLLSKKQEKENRKKNHSGIIKKKEIISEKIKKQEEEICNLKKESSEIEKEKDKVKEELLEKKKEIEKLVLESGGKKLDIKLPN